MSNYTQVLLRVLYIIDILAISKELQDAMLTNNLINFKIEKTSISK
jgi:hypothetical protein